VGWYKLKGDVFLVKELFQNFGGFVVKALENGSHAFGDKFMVEFFVSSKDLLGCSVAEGFCEDGIAVVVVQYHDVVVACGGLDWEAACLVGVDLSGGCGDVDNAGVDVVGFGAVGYCRGGCEVVCAGVWWGRGKLGGTVIFPVLVLVSHGGCSGLG
jgi:hypothetical protein